MDDNLCSEHISIKCDEYIKSHIKASEDLSEANLRALQLEFSKSEREYPTRQQLDTQLKELVTKDDLSSLNLQIKIQWGLIMLMIIMIIAIYRGE